MDIYTKTGDKGKTKLFTDQEVDKDNVRVEAYGTVDELISHLGYCKWVADRDIFQWIEKIQNQLFVVGGHLASEGFEYAYQIVDQEITELEKMIDDLKSREQFPSLEQFIIPGSTETAARFHIARTVCRRAERRIITLMKTHELNENILKYVNRLSDTIYAMARYYETNATYVHWE